MSRVLIDSETVTALANKIRRKTATADKLRVSDMLERLNMLQGHLSSAYALSIDPLAYPESVYTPSMLFSSDAHEFFFPQATSVHIYTKSTGGSNASIYILLEADEGSGTVPAGILHDVLYSTVSASALNCENVVSIRYNSSLFSWELSALVALTDGERTYDPGETIKTWSYSTAVDFSLYFVEA